MPKLATDKTCTGCFACKDACKHGAISVVIKEGHLYPHVDTHSCVECRACERTCPVVNPIAVMNEIKPRVYGGWAIDSEVRRSAASGGAFSALALHILNKGGWAVGASLEENDVVRHIAINRKEDLSLLQKSKYVQSNACKSYIKTRDLLKNGERVIYSGTPCQVAGLNNFLRHKYDNLITVEVVCNGVPSLVPVDLFKRENQARRIISFRGKKYGWNSLFSQGLEWENSDGLFMEPLQTKDIFYQVFGCGLTHRQACCNCRFACMPRQADITLADFWGIKRFPEEWKDGISLIIANSEKAERYLHECSEELHLFNSSMEECLACNPRLVNGRKYHSWHPVMKWPNYVRKIVGRKQYEAIITNKMPWKLLWGILKIFTISSNKKAIKKYFRQ